MSNPFSLLRTAVIAAALLCTLAILPTLPLSAQGCAKFYGIAQNAANLQQYRVVAIDSLTGNTETLNTVSTTTSGSTITASGITANPDDQLLYYIQTSQSGSNFICSIRSISTVNGALGATVSIPANAQQRPIALHYDCTQDKLYLVKRVNNSPQRIDFQEINLGAGTATSVLAMPLVLPNFVPHLTTYDAVHAECLVASADTVYRLNAMSGAVNTVVFPETIKTLEVNPFDNQIIAAAYDGTIHFYDIDTGIFSSTETGYATANAGNNQASAYNPFNDHYWELSYNTATATQIVQYINLNNGNIVTSYPANDIITLNASYPCTAIPDFTFEGACAGIPIQFTDASWGAADRLWNFDDPASGGNNTSTDPNPTHVFSTPGSYEVTLTVSGCLETVSRTYTVVVNGSPTTDLPDNVTTCNTTYTLNAGSAISGTSYLWNNGATTGSITATATGLYWVEISATGCVFRDSVMVTLGSLANGSIWAETEQTVCGNSIELSTNGIMGTAYLWSSGATTASVTAAQSGTYSVTITLPDGCLLSDALNLDLLNPPTVSLGNDTSACAGNDGIVLTAQTNASPSAGLTYSWSSGANTAQITVVQSGTYTVTVSNGSSTCSASDAVVVQIDTPQNPDFGNIPADICTNIGETVLLDATVPNAVQYAWSPDNGNNPTLTATAAGTYSVTVTDQSGCSSSAAATFTAACASIFVLPNAFSPNGDGANDEFKPLLQFVDAYTLSVYDRWGNRVFQSSTDNPIAWNGNNTQGRAVPTGVYVWAVSYTDQNGTNHDLKGNLMLLR